MPIPTRPWEHVASDLFDCLGSKWLICADHYSEYFEIEKMSTAIGAAVIHQTKKWFSVHGIPEVLTSDNGPPFVHNFISPKHSQANGFIEKMVDIDKRMLLKCQTSGDDPYIGLLNTSIRNTPTDDQSGSPAQRLFGRQTAIKIPTARTKLVPEIKKPEAVKQTTEARHKKAK
jgi:hypothetical protein